MKNEGKLVLDNGLTLYYYSKPLATIWGDLVVNSGSVQEPSERRGLAHLVEHVTCEGTLQHPTTELLYAAAEDHGYNINAQTSFLSITYPFHVANRHFPNTLKIASDIVFTPVLNNEAVEKEKTIILQELRDLEESISHHRGALFNSVFFRGTPAADLIIGKEEHIRSMTADDVRRYYTAYFTPPNVECFLFGNIDDSLLGFAQQTLEQYPAHYPAPKKAVISLPPLKSAEYVETTHPRLERAYGDITWRTPLWNDADQHIIPVISTILGGKGPSGLFRNIREEMKLTYSVMSSVYNDKYIGYLTASWACEPERVNDGLTAILTLVKNLQPSPRELDRALTDLETNFARRRDNPENAFQRFVSKEKDGVDYDLYEKKVLGVTLPDIEAAIKRYFQGPYQATVLRPAQKI